MCDLADCLLLVTLNAVKSFFLQSKELEDILLTALIQNKADFVELLMDHIRLGSFLTKSRLLELYNKTPRNHLLYKLLASKKEKVGQLQTTSEVLSVIVSAASLSLVLAGSDGYWFS